MLYNCGDLVYLSSNACTYAGYYFDKVLKLEDPDAFYARLKSVVKMEWMADESSDMIYIALPVPVSGNLNPEGNAVICFLVSKQELRSRIEQTSGGLIGPVSLYYDEISVYEEEEAPDKKKRAHEITGESGLRIVQSIPQYPALEIMKELKLTSLAVLLSLLAVLFYAAGHLAYRNYRPIKRLASKY